MPAAVERLGGMQAQEPKHPFIGLWTRLEGFAAERAAGARCATREVVRATLMRSTLHLFSAADYAALRMALQPPMSVALRVLGARAEGLDPEAVVPAARELLAGRPLTFDAIRAALQERFPDVNDRALGYAARTLVPLVMVPERDGRWGYPRVARVRAGRGVARRAARAGRRPRRSSTRYLGAFGPASAADLQTWSGVGGMKAVLDGMRDRARRCSPTSAAASCSTCPTRRGRAPTSTAPARFLPEFDNLVLAYDDRTRVIADEHRPLVTTKNLRVQGDVPRRRRRRGDVDDRGQAARRDGARWRRSASLAKRRAQGARPPRARRCARFAEPEAKEPRGESVAG